MPPKRSAPGLSQELIFLDRDDDLGTVKAKLESADADQIYLAVPRRAAVLRTPLEFRILARLAHEIASETIIVTDDGDRRRLAREEGFRTRHSLRSVRHLMRPSGKRAIWLPSLPDFGPLPSIGALFAIVLLIGGLAILNFYALPVMTVRLTPNTRNIERELTLWIDSKATEPDPSHGVIPGKVAETNFQVNGSAIVEGKRAIGKDRAHGETLFSNSGTALTLPAGTAVLSKSGQRFNTDSEVALPKGAKNVRAAVTATDPGSAGNVNSGEIQSVDPSVPKTVSVTNQKPTSGGTDRDGKVVTADDVAKLRDQLLKRANDQALRQLMSSVGEGKTIPPQSVQVRIVNEQFDPSVGSDADQLAGRFAVRTFGTAFANGDFNDIVTQMMLADVGEDAHVAGGGPRINTPEVAGIEGDRVKLHVQSSALVVETIDTTGISEELSGKTLAQARTLLQGVQGLAEPPEIDIWPTWSTRAYRVQVEVVGPR